jgi:GNAT superfamily N-acetyltransferase
MRIVVTKPKIQILEAAAVPAEALAAFFREVWDQRATAELVSTARRQAAAANLAEPGAEVPTTVVLADDRVVGYRSSLPVELWDGGVSYPGYWVKGLMVLPEYRNGPIGYRVLKELVGQLRRSVVLTVAPASVRLFEALGYANFGRGSQLFVYPPTRPAGVESSGCFARGPAPRLGCPGRSVRSADWLGRTRRRGDRSWRPRGHWNTCHFSDWTYGGSCGSPPVFG